MYKSSHESVFHNNICKNFDTGIYRPTSLHVLSRLPSPRVGLLYMKLLKDGQILGLIFVLLHKSQLDILQEGGVGVSGKRQNDVIKDKIDL